MAPRSARPAAVAAVLAAAAASAAAGSLPHPRLDMRRPPPRAAAAGGGANCPAAPPLAPLPPTLPGPLSDALASVSALAASLVSPTVPGYALVITYGDRVLLADAAGVANATSGGKWSPSTPSRIASVSKVLPALLAHQLADRGVVGLDAPVSATCPEFAVVNPFDGGAGAPLSGLTPSGAGITWRHLAAQLSGLQREVPAGVGNTSAALAAVAGTLLVAPPGGRLSYSNLGLAALGHLLAECAVPAAAAAAATVAGRAPLPSDLPTLTAELIIKPLGLRTTGFVNGDPGLPLDAEMAAGTDPATGAPIPQAAYDFGWMYPAGAGVSSAEELSALGRALLAAAAGVPGSVGATALGLHPATARAMLTPLFREPDGSYLQGAPWEARPRGLNATGLPPAAAGGLTGAAPFLVLNKGGNVEGYTALLALVPALNVTVAFLANGGVDEFGLSDAIADALLPPLGAALLAQDPTPRGSTGPEPPATYVGTYAGSVAGTAVAVQEVPGTPSPALAYALQVGGTYSFFLDYVGSVDVSAAAAGGGGGGGAGAAATVAGAPVPSPGPGGVAAAVTAVDIFRAFVPFPGDLPPGALPCEEDVTLGLRGQYVLFYRGDGGAVVGTAMPGFAPGLVFAPAA